jgi:hypothetical protein
MHSGEVLGYDDGAVSDCCDGEVRVTSRHSCSVRAGGFDTVAT